MRIFASVSFALLCLCVLWSCSTPGPVTTQAKVDQIGAVLTHRTQEKMDKMMDQYRDLMMGKKVEQLPPITKEDITSVLGPPVKAHMFLGVYYMLYQTQEGDFYIFALNEHRNDAGYQKIDPNDPHLETIFSANVDAHGFPPDSNWSGTKPGAETPQMAQQPETTEEARISAEQYYSKGTASTDTVKSIEYFTKALELNPNHRDAYLKRGIAYYDIEKYSQAFIDLDKALALKPEASLYNLIAWRLATCKNPDFRNPKKAIDYAEKALKMGGLALYKVDNERAEYLHTLAVACAEAGMFGDAVAAEKRANASYYPLNQAEEKKKEEMEKCLKAFKNRRTYLQMKNASGTSDISR